MNQYNRKRIPRSFGTAISTVGFSNYSKTKINKKTICQTDIYSTIMSVLLSLVLIFGSKPPAIYNSIAQLSHICMAACTVSSSVTKSRHSNRKRVTSAYRQPMLFLLCYTQKQEKPRTNIGRNIL